MIKTAHKIALARIAYNLVHAARNFVGKTDDCIATRTGNRFALDLAEGIDFAVYLGRYETSTTRALARLVRPGSIVLDIGANVGVHTVQMARLVGPQGKVFAFEPTTFAFRKLQRNLEINPDLTERVVATQCFLGPADSESAPGEIYSSWPLKGGKDLHGKHLGQPMGTDGVRSRSVDEFLTEWGGAQVALVKIDVDGYECDALAGARMMLQRDRPIFVMELAPYLLREHGKSIEDLLNFFTPLGYRFFDESEKRALPLETGTIYRYSRDGAGFNVIAKVP